MRGFYLLVISITSVFLCGSSFVLADTSTTVSATVTPELISVYVNRPQVDYGVVAIGQAEKVLAGSIINVKNNGTVNENFTVKGNDATAGASSWTLADTQGQNQFVHEFQKTAGDTNWYKMSKTIEKSLAGNLAVDASVDMNLRISMPTSITGAYTQYTTVVTVLATKT